MSEIVDFNTLSFNLYEILSVPNDASYAKIRKAYKNLTKNFHPDRNSNAEIDIFYHITTANQILTNTEYRKLYDEFLNIKSDTHNDLKLNFEKSKNNYNLKLSETEAYGEFKKKIEEMNKKHNFTEEDNVKDVKESLNKLLKERENIIEIPNEKILDNDDFNSRFENKKDEGAIITYNDKNNSLTTYNANENYTSLSLAFDNLYIDGVNTSKYSSLDTAFKIQSLDTKNVKEVDIKKAMEDYKLQTNLFKNGENIEYTSNKYELW
jgi:curved DNA-binding protein CbpA